VIDKHRAELGPVSPRDIYIAATRLVMRCVVVLFAEARGLLPITDPVYFNSYSVQGLRTLLDRQAQGRSKESLRQQVSAWPRLISLFRLIYEGSFHPNLTSAAMEAVFLSPAKRNSGDAILRAMSLFEHPANAPNDFSIHHILVLLTRAWERVPQGRTTRMVLSPIDFPISPPSTSESSTKACSISSSAGQKRRFSFSISATSLPSRFMSLTAWTGMPFEN